MADVCCAPKCNLDEVKEGQINADTPEILSADGKFRRISVCPDSGAVTFVAPPEMAPEAPIAPTEASLKGMHYTSASKHQIRNLGESDVMAYAHPN